MIKNIFPLILLFILVSPNSWTSKGENSKTLVTLSSQSSKILADFQGKDKMDTQRNESSPRDLIRNELDNNRINNLKINDEKSYSEIDEKALFVPQKTSRAFLMSTDEVVVATLLLHRIDDESFDDESFDDKSLEIDKVSHHLIVDKVIKLSSLPAIWVEMGLK